MKLDRGGWTLAVLAGLSLALLAPDAAALVGDVRGPSFPTALVALGCLVQLALSGWTMLAVTLVLLRAPTPLIRAIMPRLLRRALLAGTAGALAVTPAYADPVAAPSARHDLVGLQLPDRPFVIPAVTPPPQAALVVVRPGDTLWSIAAGSLPADASDADIARASARWYDTNRSVIGDDPDLIFPTQRLTPPPTKDPT